MQKRCRSSAEEVQQRCRKDAKQRLYRVVQNRQPDEEVGRRRNDNTKKNAVVRIDYPKHQSKSRISI